ncbi:hypothetical protein EN850_20860 [Mesorhizobium sp. M8A.F.Ca.ET.207.01.1.1]|uniref:hypothetical protein n=1 Tax=Mesorhizobium sp. M8A.F.Ca.ET.207.01.1.1 TaxID=2563968 RepID=UPI00109C93FF|nr:hypothetical protein [Mesorhizobium sp. M8A.F.Ca.ET.207.01.1.1]TGQ79342.1 hypothetical protein EN850_20860 [Mesorhizobium sp. M8A.F.Ca.ET.207.01.1.1]
MTMVPIRATRKAYRGADPQKALRVADQNRIIERIERRANEILAGRQDEIQVLLFQEIADDLSIDVDIVRDALPGGYNGLTVRVTAADREMLERFKRS